MTEPCTPRYALRLELGHDLKDARNAGRAIRDWLTSRDVPEGSCRDCELAAVEACNNAIQHATTASAYHPVVIEAVWLENAVELGVTDHSKPWDWPQEPNLPPPDQETGRGLFLIRQLMDEVALRRAHQSGYAKGIARELRAYPILADGSLGTFRTLFTWGEDDRGVHRGIDGMCLDRDGNIVATNGWEVSGPGPMITVFSPTGRVLESQPVPAIRPTNCCFGGPDLTTLFVTTTQGHFFRAETGRVG